MNTGYVVWKLSDEQLEELYNAVDEVVLEYCGDCTFKWDVCRYFFRTTCPTLWKAIRSRIHEEISKMVKK